MVILKDINLIPKSAIAKRQKADNIRIMLIALAILVGFLILIDGSIFLIKYSTAKNIAEQTKTITNLRAADVNEDVLSTVRNKIQYREDIIKKIESTQTKMNDFITTLASTMPKDASLLRLNIESNGAVIIQGKADKEESVLDFYHNLKLSNLTDYVEFTKISGTIGDVSRGFEFEFTFKLKTGSDKK